MNENREMKTEFSIGVTLIFLGLFSFISCTDKEDEIGQHYLELSANSCEVTQLRTTSISLVAHENTTLEITHPELVDATYKWESHDDFTAAIEITGKQPGETTIVVTDNVTGESGIIKVKVTGYPMPRLGVKQPAGNIFELMEFHLYNDSPELVFNELYYVCDSILWRVKDQEGAFRIFNSTGNGIHLVMKWAHCFQLPGKYETYITAWKDNKEIFSDQLNISVTDEKDFLMYDWEDITETSKVWTEYIDVLGNNPYLATAHDLNGTIPSVEMRASKETFSKSHDILYSYLRELYGEPTYEDEKEKQEIFQLYDELFSEHKKYPDGYPHAIWITERARIVLLEVESYDTFKYAVYAEPAFTKEN